MSDSGISPVFVSEQLHADLAFSVVSLVVNDDRYQRMLASFAAKGFSAANAEFFAIDNRGRNAFDGYSALRAVLPRLRGQHVLFTHDDIELTADGFAELSALVDRLEAIDPRWMIAGNAGGTVRPIGTRNAHFLHLDDPHGSFRLPSARPVRVDALDENFLVMPRHRMPLPSLDLAGFHLFAADMCLQARAAGGTCYAIPFLLFHHGSGLVDGAFPAAQRKLEDKYSRLGVRGRIQAPAIQMHFGYRARAIRQVAALRDRVAGALRRLFART